MKVKRLKLLPLYLCSFLASALPISIYFFANFDRYVKTTPQAVRLSIGAALVIMIIGLKALGRLKMPNRVVTFFILFILCYLLDSILNDLVIFLFLAFLGEVLDLVLQAVIASKNREIEREKYQSEIEKAVEKGLDRVNRV
jgi:hypothetical protein